MVQQDYNVSGHVTIPPDYARPFRTAYYAAVIAAHRIRPIARVKATCSKDASDVLSVYVYRGLDIGKGRFDAQQRLVCSAIGIAMVIIFDRSLRKWDEEVSCGRIKNKEDRALSDVLGNLLS